MIRQYAPTADYTLLYRPEDAYIVNGYSELDRTSAQFNGTHPYRGVNPATGVVMYYQLPTLKPDEHIELEIRDASGTLVRRFSSKPDSTYKRYDGAPAPDPVLSRGTGLNRFVWNMRYPTAKAIPNVYIESSYAGHKASPGKYTATLKSGAKTLSAPFEILPNPLYDLKPADYQAYHELMSGMEKNLNTMHGMVNALYDRQQQLAQVLAAMPADGRYASLRKEGDSLLQKMKRWDEDMVQRKSKAYDDVENFPNKFTANYMFLINATESEIPRVNQGSLDRKKVLESQWALLESTGRGLLDNEIPAYNRKLWEAGIGAVYGK
jgi:hypothetical protein